MADIFYDKQPGPEIRDKLNQLHAEFEYAVENAVGPKGWSPTLAAVDDGARRVLQVIDWVGGDLPKPTITGYVGPSGIVALAANALDVRGGVGLTGPANSLSIGTVAEGTAAATITGTAPAQTLNLVVPRGNTGLTGPPNSLAIGTVTQGTAAATITGTAPAQTLNLVVPKGDTGNAGPANSLSIGTVAEGTAAATITGTAPAQTLNLVVPKGNTGNTGPANSLSIGTVAEGTAAATITGTAPAQTLNLVVPKGDTGNAAWTPVFAVVNDGARRVLQVSDWIGGGGTKPTTGQYLGPTGLTPTIGSAVDVRGPAGSGDVSPTGTIVSGRLVSFNDATGNVIKDSGKSISDLVPLTGTGASGTWGISITGNAATATNVDYSGLTGAVPTWNQNTTGNAATATNVAWSGVTGKPAVIAEGSTAADARAAIGAGTSNLSDAPSDGKTYGRKDAAWIEASATPGDNNVGYLNIPQNSQSAAYTCVLADAGKHILHPAADTTARTFTIPANASVAYPIGTAITFVNQNGTGGIVTIGITTDTMRLAGPGTTGSRTLARNGTATALKVTATEWIISGSGLT